MIPRFNSRLGIEVIQYTAILIALAIPGNAAAQEGLPGRSKVLVGTVDAPPFAMQTADGNWEGLSIELWRLIAQDLRVDYEFIAYKDLENLKTDLEQGALELLIAIAITEPHEAAFDLSHAFLTSGSAIAVPAIQTRRSLMHFIGRIIDRFVSLEFLALIGSLVLLAFIAGSLVWLFESRRYREAFSDDPGNGLWQGLWWAMVTMTTVGYGDKVPRTVGGRIVAIAWMFTSIILVAVFTAAVTASLTAGELYGKVQGLHDLYGVRVGAVARTESHDYLVRREITVRGYQNPQEGLQAVADGKLDAFVFNELVLKDLARSQFSGRIQVLPEVFNRYYVGMAMPPGSAMLEPLNRALLKIIETDEWLRLKARYIGEGG
jgi:ABC-type amino acid transport substrate-binding protein